MSNGSVDPERGMTARQVVELIQTHVNCPWAEKTVDTFVAGDPDTVVAAVAVTFLATFDVLRRAAEAGCNFVITHEPTFYHGQEDVGSLGEDDPVVAAKRAILAREGLAVWRFHDHWHRHEPDGIVAGMVEALGLKQAGVNEGGRFEVEPTTVRELASTLADRVGARSVRIVGDPEMRCSRVALRVGCPASASQIKALQHPEVQVLIAGETREWETVEYVRDASAAGLGKALILLGHASSEEAGMAYLADWLRPLLPQLPIHFIPAGDPFVVP